MKSKIVVVGLLAIVLLSSLTVGFVVAENTKISYTPPAIINGVKYSSHDMIRINGDGDFNYEHGVIGGKGTKDDPYIISGWKIDAHNAGNAIYIGNTTKYFIVENCYLYNASTHYSSYSEGDGIELYDAMNGRIENNICSNNVYGIELYSSPNYFGFYMYPSSNNEIKNNICLNNGDGIYLDHSSNNVIEGNTCSHNSNAGIELFSPSNNVRGTNIIENNNCSNNDDGIDVTASNNIIRYNLLSDNNMYGISIYSNFRYSSSKNIVYGNSFYYNNGSGDSYDYIHVQKHVQAFDSGHNNTWYNTTTKQGNYWHEWAHNNDTNDQKPPYGIVDWPYKIDGSAGSKDYYPLKNSTYSMPSLPPTPPQDIYASLGDGYINLTWEKPLGKGSSPIIKYKIYKNGMPLTTVSPNQFYYNDTNVVNGQTYTYYVTAVNSAGESDKSNEVQATPIAKNSKLSFLNLPRNLWLWIIIVVIIGAIVAGALIAKKKKSKVAQTSPAQETHQEEEEEEGGMITITCPKCGFTSQVPESMRGKWVKCPKCGNMFRVT